MKAELARSIHSVEAADVTLSESRPRVLVLEGTGRIGGGQGATLDFARQLRHENDWQVVVPEPGDLQVGLVAAGIPSHMVAYPAPKAGFSLQDRLLYLPRGVYRLKQLISLVNEIQPGLLYATSRTALWAAIVGRITGKPVVVHLHMIPPTARTAWFLRRVCSMKSVKRVIVASPAIAESLHLIGEKVATVPNGIDSERFRVRPEARDEVRSELGIPAGARVSAVIGELSHAKGQLDAIRAFAALDDPVNQRLLIVGDQRGDELNVKNALAQSAEAFGVRDRVVLTGHRTDIDRILSAIDLLIVPSHGPSGESCPMVVLEAWAAGVPVLGSDVGGMRDLLGADRGGLFSHDEPGSLTVAWCDLLSDEKRRERLSRAGLEAAQTAYSLPQASRRIQSVIEAAIAA